MGKLSYSKKKTWKPIIISQTGENCFFCERVDNPLDPLELGHLNSNDEDNRPENLAYMCHTCNNRMKFNFDMRILANEQLKKNEKAVYVCERTSADSGTEINIKSCREINQLNTTITEQFLYEWTARDEELIVKDAVDAITNLCHIQNGTGSQPAIYRYVKSLCNPFTGKFTIYSNPQGKDCIRKRIENLKVI